MHVTLNAKGHPNAVVNDVWAQIKQARNLAPDLSPELVLLRDAVCKKVREEQADGAEEVEVKVSTEVRNDPVDQQGRITDRAPVFTVTGEHVKVTERPVRELVEVPFRFE